MKKFMTIFAGFCIFFFLSCGDNNDGSTLDGNGDNDDNPNLGTFVLKTETNITDWYFIPSPNTPSYLDKWDILLKNQSYTCYIPPGDYYFYWVEENETKRKGIPLFTLYPKGKITITIYDGFDPKYHIDMRENNPPGW